MQLQWMSENRMFGLENLTKFGSVIERSVFGRSECSVCFWFVRFIFSTKLDHFIYKTIFYDHFYLKYLA